jgi:hypothetical protein
MYTFLALTNVAMMYYYVRISNELEDARMHRTDIEWKQINRDFQLMKHITSDKPKTFTSDKSSDKIF